MANQLAINNIQNYPVMFWKPGIEISKDIGRDWREKRSINRKREKNGQWFTWDIK